MTRSKLPFDRPIDHLRISRWDDPVVDSLGHDPRSPYVERFWLALLGPTTTFLVRHLAAELEAQPDGFDLPLEESARMLGLGLRGGLSGPFYRALARTGQFHITRANGPAELAARTRLQPLTRHQVDRLPARLRAEHAEWTARAAAAPSPDQQRVRARRLALGLLELGDAPEAAEIQLHRWEVHPGTAHEALRWAQARREGRPAPAAVAALAAVPPRPHPPAVFDPAGDAA